MISHSSILNYMLIHLFNYKINISPLGSYHCPTMNIYRNLYHIK